RELSLELAQHGAADRDSIVQRYSSELGADLYLFGNDVGQLAGRPVKLPAVVENEIHRPPPQGPFGGPGGPPGMPPGPPPPAGRRAKGPPPPPGDPGAVFFVWAKGDVPYWIGARLPVRSQ